MAASDRSAVVGLDTSVVLRLLVGAPAEQATAALTCVKKSLAARRRVVESDLVVSEAYVALHAHYGVPKQEAVAALLELLNSGLVEAGDGPGIAKLLEAAAQPPAKPGFVDRLIHAQYQRMAASMATFEHAAGRLAGTTVL